MDIDYGTVVAERYLVEHEIGRGGMGAVYRVEHVETGERFALKVLGGTARFEPMALRRFQREAKSSAAIKSEHVVKIIDADVADELDGAPFLVMELLDGRDLERRVTEDGPIAPEVLVPLLAQVASALDLAHAAGIVHRDIKPENLFEHRRADGTTTAKVLDFGISKMMNTSDIGAESTSASGVVMGTPLYMAPEQARGAKSNREIDIWALGQVAIRLLTGEHYWGRPTLPELMQRLINDEIPAPSVRYPDNPLMTPELDAWFRRACAREPADRWTSAGAEIQALANALGQPLPERTEAPANRDLAPTSPRGRPMSHLASTLPEEAPRKPPPKPLAALAQSPAKSTPPPPPRASTSTPTPNALTDTAPRRKEGAPEPVPARKSGTLAGIAALVGVGAIAIGIAFSGPSASDPSSTPTPPHDAGLPPAATTPHIVPVLMKSSTSASAAPSAPPPQRDD